MWQKTDSLILDNLEKLAHKFELIFHKSNFWLARYTILLGIVAGISVISVRLATNEYKLAMYDSFNFISLISISRFRLMYFSLDDWQYLEDRARSRLVKGLKNPERLNFHLRFAILFISGFTLIASVLIKMDTIYLTAVFTSISIAQYLKACDPLPPGNAKINLKERILGLFRKPIPVES